MAEIFAHASGLMVPCLLAKNSLSKMLFKIRRKKGRIGFACISNALYCTGYVPPYILFHFIGEAFLGDFRPKLLKGSGNEEVFGKVNGREFPKGRSGSKVNRFHWGISVWNRYFLASKWS